jgi:hypothetical protein
VRLFRAAPAGGFAALCCTDLAPSNPLLHHRGRCRMLPAFGPSPDAWPSQILLRLVAVVWPLESSRFVAVIGQRKLAKTCGDSGRGRQRSYWILLGNPRPRPSEAGLQKLAVIGRLWATLETCQILHLFRPSISELAGFCRTHTARSLVIARWEIRQRRKKPILPCGAFLAPRSCTEMARPSEGV